MAQRVRIPHRGQSPSSATQLPILAALHARFPTLFAIIIYHFQGKYNGFAKFFTLFVYEMYAYALPSLPNTRILSMAALVMASSAAFRLSR